MPLGPDNGGRDRYDLTMSQVAHIKVSGDLQGDFVVTEEHGADEFVIVREPEPSWREVQARAGAREMTPEEFEAFMAEHGPHVLPPTARGSRRRTRRSAKSRASR